MRYSLLLWTSLAGTGPVLAQHATYSVLLSAGPLPPPPGSMVSGTVRLTWTDPQGVGYFGGAFRLRMEGLAIADVLAPIDTYNPESFSHMVGVPAAELPAGAGTVSTNWTIGRRPKRAYLADENDPTSLLSGGGFRFPGTSPTSPVDIHYSVEPHGGVTYLTARNGAGVEHSIEHAQVPRDLQSNPFFFEPGTSIDLFKFLIRAPLSGNAVTITPEVLYASIFTSNAGASYLLTTDQISAVSAGWPAIPSPGAGIVLGVGIGAVARRRR